MKEETNDHPVVDMKVKTTYNPEFDTCESKKWLQTQ